MSSVLPIHATDAGAHEERGLNLFANEDGEPA
jgi:hypothetical protein